MLFLQDIVCLAVQGDSLRRKWELGTWDKGSQFSFWEQLRDNINYEIRKTFCDQNEKSKVFSLHESTKEMLTKLEGSQCAFPLKQSWVFPPAQGVQYCTVRSWARAGLQVHTGLLQCLLQNNLERGLIPSHFWGILFPWQVVTLLSLEILHFPYLITLLNLGLWLSDSVQGMEIKATEVSKTEK